MICNLVLSQVAAINTKTRKQYAVGEIRGRAVVVPKFEVCACVKERLLCAVWLDPDPNPNRPSTTANMQKSDFFMAAFPIKPEEHEKDEDGSLLSFLLLYPLRKFCYCYVFRTLCPSPFL